MKFKLVKANGDMKAIHFIKAIRFFSGVGLKEAKDACDNVRFHNRGFELSLNPNYANIDYNPLYNNVEAFLVEAASHGVILTIDHGLHGKLVESATIAITEGRLVMARDLLNMALDIIKD